MSYWRYQVWNFYLTTLAQDHDLVPWSWGTLPLVASPNIEDGKMFFIAFNVTDIVNRFVLPVYMDWTDVKYRWYDVTVLHELKKYDEVAINDVAELFNTLYTTVDDFGKILLTGWLNIDVYGGNVVIGNDRYYLADTSLVLADNTTNYVILDYADQTLKAVEVLPSAYYGLAEIVTVGWVITSNTWKRSFNVNSYFSSLFFEKNANGEIIIKAGSVTWNELDFTSFDSDDIFEWATHLFLSTAERAAIAANTSARHTHTNKALLDTYDQTNANITDAITKKHAHTNKPTLDLLPDAALATEGQVMVKRWATIAWETQSWGGGGWSTVSWMDIFLGDWMADTFTLNHLPVADNAIFMYNDSGERYFSGIDYTRNWTDITFLDLPDAGRLIYIQYFEQISISQVGETNTMMNLPWAWFGIYKQKTGVQFEMRRITGINGITVSQVGDEIIIDWMVQVWPGWEINSWSNIWSWAALYAWKTWVVLKFRTLIQTPTINTFESLDWDHIEISVNENWLSNNYYRHFMF